MHFILCITWRLIDVCNLTAMGLHAMEQGQKNKWNYIAIVLFFLLGLSSTCHVILFHTCMTCLYLRNFWVTCNYTCLYSCMVRSMFWEARDYCCCCDSYELGFLGSVCAGEGFFSLCIQVKQKVYWLAVCVLFSCELCDCYSQFLKFLRSVWSNKEKNISRTGTFIFPCHLI
jgi:hypothetical protein